MLRTGKTPRSTAIGVIFCVLCTGLLVAPAAAQVQGGQLQEIEGEGQRDQLQVVVRSPDAELQRHVQRAFSFHGAFEVRASGRSHFVFEFEPVGRSTVELVISSAGQQLLQERFEGRDTFQAAAKAADYAVRRTTNRPGFFAGTISFVSERTGHPEIYMADFLLGELVQLTRKESQSMLPALAPDGSKLLFTSYFRNGFPDLYEIDLRTNELKVFAGFRGLNTGASFSPDGSRVALILSGSGNAEVFTANAQGGQFQRLTRTAALEADPHWSPDGRRIVYTSDELGRPQIFVMNADGSGRRRLPTNVSRNCSEPTWNPVNANQIAFTAAVAGEFEICLYEMGGGDARILTRGAGDAVGPVWLPDGRHLLYTQRTRNSSRLAVLDTLTGRQTPLTPESWGACSMPDYAPFLRR
ncbi:MAG: biopolymer transporter Tol [Opitutales bacterium]